MANEEHVPSQRLRSRKHGNGVSGRRARAHTHPHAASGGGESAAVARPRRPLTLHITSLPSRSERRRSNEITILDSSCRSHTLNGKLAPRAERRSARRRFGIMGAWYFCNPFKKLLLHSLYYFNERKTFETNFSGCASCAQTDDGFPPRSDSIFSIRIRSAAAHSNALFACATPFGIPLNTSRKKFIFSEGIFNISISKQRTLAARREQRTKLGII